MSAVTTEGLCEIHGLITTLRELADEFVDAHAHDDLDIGEAFFTTLITLLQLGGLEEDVAIDVVENLPHPSGCCCEGTA